MQETMHLLASPRNAERLLASIAELDAGRRGARADRAQGVKIAFSSRAWDEYLHWQARDEKVLARVNALLKECMRVPSGGTGKPEPLGRNFGGWWSRRINEEQRLVYRVTGKDEAQVLEVAQCQYH